MVESGDGFEAAQISARVNAVVEEAWPLADRRGARSVERDPPQGTRSDPVEPGLRATSEFVFSGGFPLGGNAVLNEAVPAGGRRDGSRAWS